MATPFPILSERFTAGVAGIGMMPQLGFIGENGRCGGFNPDVPLDRLMELFIGPGAEYCKRFAKAVRALPPGSRWAQLGGGFGNVYPLNDTPAYRTEHRRITIEAFRRYVEECWALDVELDGVVIDDEDENPRKNADDLHAILYDSGILDPQTTRAVCWYIFDGKGEHKDEYGNKVETRGLVDGRTACVHGYLRRDTGVDLEQQAADIIAQAVGALALGHGFVPLLTGATHNQVGQVYNVKEREAYTHMARELARLGPAAVWLFPTGGHGSPAPLRRKGDGDDVIDADWAVVMDETLATLGAFGRMGGG